MVSMLGETVNCRMRILLIRVIRLNVQSIRKIGEENVRRVAVAVAKRYNQLHFLFYLFLCDGHRDTFSLIHSFKRERQRWIFVYR